ncbi:MAG: hypothetical protein PHT94_02850 [Candidatus Nanoarchaeia archaeon]|nr:hypothetical protein [Candidatus Nanoarchaeia archaeon]
MSCDGNCNGDCEHDHEHNHIGVEEIARHNNFLISVLIKTLINKGIITDEDMNNTVKEFQDSIQDSDEESDESIDESEDN